MQLILKEKYGDDLSNHPEFDQELWSLAAGGKNKGKVFGLGKFSDPYSMADKIPRKLHLREKQLRIQTNLKDLEEFRKQFKEDNPDNKYVVVVEYCLMRLQNRLEIACDGLVPEHKAPMYLSFLMYMMYDLISLEKRAGIG